MAVMGFGGNNRNLTPTKLPMVKSDENFPPLPSLEPNPEDYAPPKHRDEYKPNLDRLADHIAKVPINDIAVSLKALTYGEMIEFSELFMQAGEQCKCWPKAVNAETIARIFHCLATERFNQVKAGMV